jgi:hypothetical protein
MQRFEDAFFARDLGNHSSSLVLGYMIHLRLEKQADCASLFFCVGEQTLQRVSAWLAKPNREISHHFLCCEQRHHWLLEYRNRRVACLFQYRFSSGPISNLEHYY